MSRASIIERARRITKALERRTEQGPLMTVFYRIEDDVYTLEDGTEVKLPSKDTDGMFVCVDLRETGGNGY